MYCSRCKGTDVPFMKGTKSKYGVQYYTCRPCNTLRMKNYLATKAGRAKVYEAVYYSIRNNKEKHAARARFHYALKLGKIKRPERCKCGNSPVQGHHTNYNEALKVKWLCRDCHFNLHKKLNAQKV